MFRRNSARSNRITGNSFYIDRNMSDETPGTLTPSRYRRVDGASGAGHLSKHFDGADGATTEKGKHPRRKYNNVASEASETRVHVPPEFRQK